MMFMNEYEIDRAAVELALDPVLGPGVQTLINLKNWTNQNSDGWAYWPKPCRAAARLQELISEARKDRYYGDELEVTPAQLRRALVPIKAFRTRQGADFEIVEV